jgi:Fic family protein
MALSWTPSPPLSSPATLSFEQLAQRVRSEYREMPGLNVTRDQARCLWALEPETCDRLLAHLVRSGFLVRTSQNTYVRAT